MVVERSGPPTDFLREALERLDPARAVEQHVFGADGAEPVNKNETVGSRD